MMQKHFHFCRDAKLVIIHPGCCNHTGASQTLKRQIGKLCNITLCENTNRNLKSERTLGHDSCEKFISDSLFYFNFNITGQIFNPSTNNTHLNESKL